MRLLFLISTTCLSQAFAKDLNGRSIGEIADPETTTPHGCTCTSLCSPTADDLFTKDWCYTANNCGEYTFGLGYWDYCLYLDRQKPDYVSLTWQEKRDMLWSKIKEDQSISRYYSEVAFTESVKTSFDDEWDVMPNGRHKAIHSVGAVCPFKIDVAHDSPYTGLLKAGSTIEGFARLGSASDPYALVAPTRDLTPGVGIKFLRTGVTSANFVLLHSLDPLPNSNFNFFALPISNHISGNADTIALQSLAQKFCQTEYCLGKVGVSHLTTFDQDGQASPNPVFPFKLTFLAADINFPETRPSSLQELVDRFKTVPIGSKLYAVQTHSSPDDTQGSLLGYAVTTDNCVTSKFGDMKLFFRHRPVEEDMALKPEWKDAYMLDCGTENCL